jgi:hypothetical protein
MAGAAGGALQTAQRVGGAIGTAALAGVFAMVLANNASDFSVAVSDTLLCAAGAMVLALVLAVTELVRGRAVSQPREPTPRPEHDLHASDVRPPRTRSRRRISHVA